MGAPLTGAPAVPVERRVCARVELASLSGVIHLRLPPGRHAVLLNLSQEGACIEATSRLLPGGRVEVLISTRGFSWRGRAIVKRCRVSALVPDHGARYLAALQFDKPLEPSVTMTLIEAAREAGATGYVLPKEETGANGRWAATTRRLAVRSADDTKDGRIEPK